MADVNKVAALVIRDKKLLVMHKRDYPAYISLGGRVEPGESDLECLQRELQEEVGCNPVKPVFFHTFEGTTLEGASIRMPCYFCELDGEITLNPQDKVDGYLWIDKEYKKKKIVLAPILEQFIVPALVKKGVL